MKMKTCMRETLAQNAKQRFWTLLGTSRVKDFALQKLQTKVWPSVPGLKAAVAQQSHEKRKAEAQMKNENEK